MTQILIDGHVFMVTIDRDREPEMQYQPLPNSWKAFYETVLITVTAHYVIGTVWSQSD